MLDSRAFTKIQSVILIVVIVVALAGGSLAYILLTGDEQFDTIKIGLIGNIDGLEKEQWQSVILAAEHLNAEGGILGRQVEVIAEDNDAGEDASLTANALNRLISYHEVDFILGAGGPVIQEIIAEHKKIFLAGGGTDADTQKVVDNYDRYKYYFNCGWNSSASFQTMTGSFIDMRGRTGFNKIGYLGADNTWIRSMLEGLDWFLPENGFELVYQGTFPEDTVDFSSYFAAAEAAGTEALLTLVYSDSGIPLVKEYHDRQSPIFLFGGLNPLVSLADSYEWTGGKCEDVCLAALPVGAGYPITNKTVATREAYIERWKENPFNAQGYDMLRFVLADAIERAGTTETEAVIKALEETSIETANARNFVFAKAHCAMIGMASIDPEDMYTDAIIFQWQNGTLIPIWPNSIMKIAGSTYTYPDWPGPWD